MKRFIVTLLFAVTPSTALAQAWTKDAGEAYLNVSYRHLSGDRYYGPSGDTLQLDRTYRQDSVSIYGEVGIIDRWLTATLGGELFRQSQVDERGLTRGLGDFRVGLWSGLVTEPLRLTLGVQVGLPTGDPEPRADSADGDVTARSLPTGDGEVEILPTVAAGWSYAGEAWPLVHYITGSLSYQLRTSGFADGVGYKLEVGTKIPLPVLDRFWIIGRLTGVESFATNAEAAAGQLHLGDGLTHTTIGAELFGKIYDGFGASIGFDSAVRARGVIAARPVYLTLSYEL